MSDSTGHRTDDTAPADKPWKKDTKNVPPLVWVIVAALVAMVVAGFLYARSSMTTPSGAEVPAAASETDVLAPQPATAEPAAAPAAGS